MKSILVFFVVLFFIITPVHAQLLSDTTGLINRFDIETSGHNFEIVLTSNFDLLNYDFDKDSMQLTLYLDSGLENNLGEIIIPSTLLNGDFTFYLNNQEFFPKIQSNDKINFITLNFTGLGTNVIEISSTEYLSGLNEIISIDNKPSSDILYNATINESSSDNYLIWVLVSGIAIVVIIFVMKFIKNKN